MTPRDYYIAAAVQGLLARGDFPVADVHAEAADVADSVAAEACKRWGHTWAGEVETRRNDKGHPVGERRECSRCGQPQTRNLVAEHDTWAEHDEWKDAAEGAPSPEGGGRR